MAQGVPRPAGLPPGPARDLVFALHDLYRAAGMPSMRTISTKIRQRNDLTDTVSHETVGQMLRGEAVPGWIKFECVVRQLAALAVHHPDVEAEVKRFHELWLPAFSGTPGTPSATPAARPRTSAEPPKLVADLVGDMPARNIRFVGREHLIQTIHEILRTGARVVTLNGIGGVGKTQLAIEYLHRFQDQYELVWWIPAEHPSQLRASLAELGTRLRLPRSEAMQHPPAQVLDALARGKRRYLLVFDNAGRPDRLPPLTNLGPGRVLITSRDPDWTYHGSQLEIGVFQREESVRLLRDRAHLGAADAELVAEKLGDLPLAVDQVALHLATGVPVGAFLDDLDQQLRAVLSDPRAKATSYPAMVPGFLNVAFTQLAESAPAAAQLLELFAWVGAEPLSLTLLRSGRQGAVTSPLREAVRHAPTLNSAVKDLRRHGLVAVIDGDPVRIQVHRVVQRVLKDWLGEIRLARGRANIQAILAAANPGEPDDSRFWGHYAEVSPHVIAADLATATEFEVRRVALDQVRYLFRIGHYQESRALGEQLVSASLRGGSSDADHHFYVLARHHLGNVLRMLGEYAAARQVTVDALEYLGSHPEFGPQHEYVADLDKNRAADLKISGEYDRALTVEKASLRRLEKDDADEDRIRTINSNIAVSFRLLGRFGEAHERDEEIVRWRTAVRGAQDPRTLFARSNLARDLFGLGRYADALNEVRAVLPAYRTMVGENHHGVLMAVRTEVMALRKLGDAWEAVRLAEQNREDLDTWFGARHEYTLAAGISLVNARLAVRDLGTAAVEAPELFAGCAELFGPEHPMTLAVMVNWASVLRALGDVRGALRRDEEAAGTLRRVLGEEHPYTLCAEHNLAVDLAMQSRTSEATASFRSVLSRSVRVRGESHPDTEACAANVSGERKQWIVCDIEPPPA